MKSNRWNDSRHCIFVKIRRGLPLSLYSRRHEYGTAERIAFLQFTRLRKGAR